MSRLNFFSVIIPTYNSSNYVKRSLESVVNQTHRDFEIIIVDDGSTDNTVETIHNYLGNQTDISYQLLFQKNSGAGSARNRGILNAQYQWIAFLDSDDLWHKDKLAVMSEVINESTKHNFFCHNEHIIELDGSQGINYYSRNFNYAKSLVSQLYERNYFSTSAIVVEKSILLRHSGFDVSFWSAQDYEMWLRISGDINVKFVDEVLGTYVMRRGNISTSYYWIRLVNILRIKFIHRRKVGFYLFVKTSFIAILVHTLIPIVKKTKFF